jgi:signal transduction histidine kinase
MGQVVGDELNEAQLRKLLGVGRALVSELDIESLLDQILDTARELTDARYAALGILDSAKAKLERFLHQGIDEETRRGIGPLPQGRGVLGELIRHPEPLRLSRVGDHPRSYGFPPGHPPMDSFVGVPIQIRGEAFGNIYLTEKRGGADFDARDEAMLVILADWAAVAIDNARVYEQSEERRAELERAVQALEATVSLAQIGAVQEDIEDLFELIAKRGRALVNARCMLVLAPGEAGQLRVGAAAGEVPAGLRDRELAVEHSLLVGARREGTVQHLHGGRSSLFDDLETEARAALVMHMEHRGHSQGFLVALDAAGRLDFGPDDELVFTSFASSAANSLGIARDVERDRLRLSIEASEQERRRWAMELHDETLQELGALKVMQEGALGRGDPETMRKSLTSASSQLERTIASLESLINELRPAALDELGIAAAIETLVDRVSARGEIAGEVRVDLAHERGEEPTRLSPQIEATIYRVVQEALNNTVKHAEASCARVTITEATGSIAVVVEDDGKGFTPGSGHADRFGLHGMRERVGLVDGEFEVVSAPGAGTRVEAHLPARRVEEEKAAPTPG